MGRPIELWIMILGSSFSESCHELFVAHPESDYTGGVHNSIEKNTSAFKGTQL